MKTFVVVVRVLFCATISVAQSTKPADFTQHDWAKAMVAYNHRTLVDAYDHDGHADQQLDVPAHAFLERMAIRFGEAWADAFYRSEQGTSTDEMVQLAAPLDKCDDPIVNYCRAVILKDSHQIDAYTTLMSDAAPKVMAGIYPAVRMYHAAATLVALYPKNSKIANQCDDLLLPYLVSPMADPIERRLRLADIEKLWDSSSVTNTTTKAAKRQKLLDALAADHSADPWLVAMLRGVDGIAAAWESRGSGWADTVTPEGWAGFKQHIAEARKALESAYKLEPSYPESAANMVTVCKAESGAVDNARIWFDRAKSAQIDYMPAWNAYCQALRPRWGGSMESLYALGQESLNTKRFDTIVPFFMVTTLDAMTEENGEGTAVYRHPGVWDDLAAMFDGYLKPVQPGVDVAWYGTLRAGFAWRCGMYDEALRNLNALDDQVKPNALKMFDITLPEMRDECLAKTGKHVEAINNAMQAEANLNYATALNQYNDLLKTLPADDTSRSFCERRQLACSFLARLADTKPADVPLENATDLLTWDGEPGQWAIEQGVLTCAAPPAAEAQLTYRVPIPKRCRIHIEWSWTSPAAGHAPAFIVTVHDTGVEGLVDVGNYPRDNIITMELMKRTLFARQAPQYEIHLTPEAWHTLDIDRNGKTISVTEDNNVIVNKHANPWFLRGKPSFALAVRNSSVGGTVKVRKITIEPGS